MALAEVFTPELTGWLMAPLALDDPIGLEEVVHRPKWMAVAACQGERRDLFFPRKGEGTAPSKAICAGCPVRPDCLEYALADPELVGVWAGRRWERERSCSRPTSVAGEPIFEAAPRSRGGD